MKATKRRFTPKIMWKKHKNNEGIPKLLFYLNTILLSLNIIGLIYNFIFINPREVQKLDVIIRETKLDTRVKEIKLRENNSAWQNFVTYLQIAEDAKQPDSLRASAIYALGEFYTRDKTLFPRQVHIFFKNYLNTYWTEDKIKKNTADIIVPSYIEAVYDVINEKSHYKRESGIFLFDCLNGNDKEEMSFDHFKLIKIVFYQANLNSAYFKNADLRGAIFKKTDLDNSMFENVNLGYSKFTTNGKIKSIIFNKVNLEYANINNINIECSNFNKVKVNNTLVKGASLRQCNIDNSLLKNSIFLKSRITHSCFKMNEFNNSDLSSTIIVNTRFSQCTFNGAIFDNALLIKVNMSKSVIIKSQFKNAVASMQCKADIPTNLPSDLIDIHKYFIKHKLLTLFPENFQPEKNGIINMWSNRNKSLKANLMLLNLYPDGNLNDSPMKLF